MKQTFKSKIDYLFIIIIVSIVLYMIFDLYNTCSSTDTNALTTKGAEYLIGLLIVIPIIFFTRYDISADQKIIVKCGFIPYGSYDISKIVKISDTHSIWAAPAASIDRINIVFTNGKNLVISPKDKKGFINLLLQINPNIKVSCTGCETGT